MLILKLIQKLIKTLNSDGTPGQVAAGFALGAALGLTPLMNVHNLVLLALAMVLNVSLGGFFLGWAVCVPVGFALDPLFNAVGAWLLGSAALRPLWTWAYNVPAVPFTRFNNTVVLGSVVVWALTAIPVFFLMRWGTARYRERVLGWLRRTHLYHVVTASKLYLIYRSISAWRA